MSAISVERVVEAVNALKRKEIEYASAMRLFNLALTMGKSGHGVEGVAGILYPSMPTLRGYCGVGAEMAAAYFLEQFPDLEVDLCQGTVNTYNPQGLDLGKSVFHIWFDVNKLISVDMAGKQFNPQKNHISSFTSDLARANGYYEYKRLPFTGVKIPGMRFLNIPIFQGDTPKADLAFIDLLDVFAK